jgi:hypothetical protein
MAAIARTMSTSDWPDRSVKRRPPTVGVLLRLSTQCPNRLKKSAKPVANGMGC